MQAVIDSATTRVAALLVEVRKTDTALRQRGCCACKLRSRRRFLIFATPLFAPFGLWGVQLKLCRPLAADPRAAARRLHGCALRVRLVVDAGAPVCCARWSPTPRYLRTVSRWLSNKFHRLCIRGDRRGRPPYRGPSGG